MIELGIGGTLLLVIYKLNGEEVTKKQYKSILKDLKSSDLVLSLNSRTISSIENLNKTLYTFEIVVCNDVEYDFLNDLAE